MGKGFIRKIFFLLILLLSSCSYFQNMHSEASEFFFEVKTDKTAKVFVFDGFELSEIKRDAGLIREKIPVTKGNYFALFFVKEGYIPRVEVLQAGDKGVKLPEIELKEILDKDMGILTGVVYKPLGGGKILPRKGIWRLVEGAEIKVVNEKGISYTTSSDNRGVFSIRLEAGKYRVSTDDKGFDVVIEKGRTTIHNIQKGMMLID